MNWITNYFLAKNLDGLKRYVEHHIPTGDFLKAVLENDLTEAVARADDENQRVIPIYVSWLYNEAPSKCWGSPEAVRAWLAHAAIRALKNAAPQEESPRVSNGHIGSPSVPRMPPAESAPYDENTIKAREHQESAPGETPSYAEIAGAIARGWSTPRNSHKAMDTDLASSITVEVDRLLRAAPL